MGIHFKIFTTDEAWAAAERGLTAAGQAEVVSLKSNALRFVARLEADYPAIYAGIKAGVADVKNAHLSGGEKAVKVAMDVLATAPAIIQAIPGIKDALVVAVTAFFADEISDFKMVAITGIAAAVLGSSTTTATVTVVPAAVTTTPKA